MGTSHLPNRNESKVNVMFRQKLLRNIRAAREIFSDLAYVIKNNQKYGDRALARRKREAAELYLKRVTEKSQQQEQSLLSMKEQAASELGSLRVFAANVDSAMDRQIEGVKNIDVKINREKLQKEAEKSVAREGAHLTEH